MLTFTRNTRDADPVTGTVDLVIGNKLTVKLNGLGPDKKHYQVTSDSPCIDVKQKADERFQEQTIRFEARMACQGARITALSGTGEKFLTGLTFNVVPRLELPPVNTDEGALARVLLAESITPDDQEFPGGEASLTSMRLIQQVLLNRLGFPDISVFNRPSARTITALIMAGLGNEVKGFGAYPNIEAKQARLIANILTIGNDASDRRYALYRDHIKRALDVVTGTVPRLEGDYYGWRTKESSHPGGAYEQPYNIAGQTFIN
ncbi:hypothetical protein [Pseudomonas mangiferae]|uniref:Uncharacterized protein n=1 Tax=Pseudomonas mangiferae TaxID=2593654 RepID=A0A553H076_9PSED|nr:hypothetical protein [Pseudomonas mangiferae]TRX75140.1 hypothetical protein FM069_08550 [Pseudomonas mangiferae]